MGSPNTALEQLRRIKQDFAVSCAGRGTISEADTRAKPYIMPAQFFALSLSEEKGLNPDQPRAVSKVTRTL